MFRILIDKDKRGTKPPAMPRWLKMLFLLAIGLLVVMVMMFLETDAAGSPAGLAILMLFLLGFGLFSGFILWSFLTWAIYSALHHVAPWWRGGMTLLFFLAPAVPLTAVLMLFFEAQATDSPDPVSKQAVTLAGIVFPAGSELEYEQYGKGDNKLIGVQASAPLSLGPLSVTGIKLVDPPGEERLRVQLASPQTIDGWHCNPDATVEVTRINMAARVVCQSQPGRMVSLCFNHKNLR